MNPSMSRESPRPAPSSMDARPASSPPTETLSPAPPLLATPSRSAPSPSMEAASHVRPPPTVSPRPTSLEVFRAAPPPPPRHAPHHKFLSVETRRAACTHLTMARMFDTFGPHRCFLCHRVPRNGYVWWCTQDHGTWLPQFEYMTETNPAWSVSHETTPGEEVDIKPWMVKAIAEGHYTPDQIRFIKEQRQNVHNTIAALEKEYHKSTSAASSPPPLPPPPTAVDDVIALPSVGLNPYLPLPMINEAEDQSHHVEEGTLQAEEQILQPENEHTKNDEQELRSEEQRCMSQEQRHDPAEEQHSIVGEQDSVTEDRQPKPTTGEAHSTIEAQQSNFEVSGPEPSSEPSKPSPKSPDSESHSSQVLESIKEPTPTKFSIPPAQGLAPAMFPTCNYRACANCRPSWKDRCWAAFEDTTPANPTFPPAHEIMNRRLSKQRIVANLGLRQPIPPGFVRSWSDLGIVYSNYSPSNFLSRQNSNYVDSDDTEDFETNDTNTPRRGIRASLKKAFKNVISSHKRDSRDSSTSSRSRRFSRKLRRQEQDSEEGDIGLRSMSGARKDLRTATTQTVLEEAAGTVLPDSDGRTEETALEHDFEEGEVELDDGVAVTEEGVGMGAADIIMQA